MSPGRAHLAAAAALAALVLATHGGVVRNGFVWDDRTLVAGNEALARPDVVVRAFRVGTWELADPMRTGDHFYRPLGVLSLALDRALGGPGPAGFHLDNLLLHLAVVLLLYALLRRRGAGAGAAAAAAAWFATLPASVEAVAWVAARFDLLGTALVLLAFLVHRSARPAARVATPLLVLAALLAKEAFVVAPALLVLDDVVQDRPARLGAFVRANLARHGALAAAVVGYLGLRAAVVTAQAPVLAGRSAGVIAVDALSTAAGLLGLAAAPLPLSVTRAYAPLDPWGLALAAGGALALAAAAWRVRELRLGLAWFGASCLLPSLVVRPTGFLGERYLYFPAVGLALALGAAAGLLRSAPLRRAAVVAAALVIAGQAWAARARVPAWRDDRALFSAALEADPGAWFAMFELGLADARDGAWDRAAVWYRRALALDRSDPRLLSNAAAAFDHVGDPAAAVEVGRLAVAASPGNPRARYNLALPLLRLGHLEEARRQLDAALELAPGYEKARALRDSLPPPRP